MIPMEELIYEYALLRYVPDIERGEQVNVGLLMMCKRLRWLRVATMVDEGRIGSLFRKADVALLARQLSAFRDKGVPGADLPVEERYRWMAAVKSAVIQTSPSHPGIVPGVDAGSADARERLEEIFDTLFSRLVAT